jgi:Na+-transporting methylmalonyl-CoA/oxaloacetate decarboxylase gamma subunit
MELSDGEGPFVSFTDLFIGILFLFLILVAALMLMHQEAVQTEQDEAQKMQTKVQMLSEQIQQLQAKLDAVPPKPNQPEFRLGIVFNIYQRGAGENWTFSRTVRVFRSATGVCINTVWMRSNLSTAWMPPVADADIPTAAQKDELRSFKPCGISASGDHWETSAETGNLKRVSKDLYSGAVILHKPEGDARLEMQYRVLDVFDNFFVARL